MRDCRKPRVFCSAEDCDREITNDPSAFFEHPLLRDNELPLCRLCGEKLLSWKLRGTPNWDKQDE